MTFVGDVEMNFWVMEKCRTENTGKRHDEGLIPLRIIQETIILWLQSFNSHKCGLDICSDRN